MSPAGVPDRAGLARIRGRVAVRFELPEPGDGPRLTDVVGTAVPADDRRAPGGDRLVVRRRDASQVEVPVGAIVAVRAIPPTPFRPVDTAAVLRAMVGGRPAIDTEPLGEWWLRASRGWTGRANSAICHGDPGVGLAEALARIEEFYRGHRLPALAYVIGGTGTERAILTNGWQPAKPAECDAYVMHTSLDTVTAAPLVEVVVSDQPDSGWYAVRFDGAEPPAGAREVLQGGQQVGFATVAEGGRPVGVGRASVVGSWVGIDGLHVRPADRRRGYATALLQGLARWGAGQGARRAYLEVQVANEQALVAYRGLGFCEAFRYRYLRPPGGG